MFSLINRKESPRKLQRRQRPRLQPRLEGLENRALLSQAGNLLSAGQVIDLNANFRLFGEVDRFGLGYGDMHLHFGVNVPAGGFASDIGGISFSPGGAFVTSGVLAPLSLPSTGFSIVDINFSVHFSLEVGQPASMYIGLGDSGNGIAEGGSVQIIFDFSDNISVAVHRCCVFSTKDIA